MTTINDLFTKPVLIFGCGNILVGDDGFGPAVVNHLLANFELPAHVAALDAGTTIRELLFDLALSPGKPRAVFIVDCLFGGAGAPGELIEVDIAGAGSVNVNDFSMHQFPSINLLRELQQEAGVRVKVLAARAAAVPERIGTGLSKPLRAAVPKACEWLLAQIEETP